jgi:probable F420-dependent oxidoreductase
MLPNAAGFLGRGRGVVQIGLSLPFIGAGATPDAISALAVAAEELAYDSVWVGDHVVFPSGYESSYPYSAEWSGPPSDTPVLDPIAVLSFVAGLTDRVRLGTSVILLPARNPVLQAKALASLDVLSSGRTIFGVGIGWLQEEYEALGVPFERRGARADEYLDLITLLWRGEEVSFRGEFYCLPPCIVAPTPVQRPRPPIWIGGNSVAALRRVARSGDGWIAAFADVAQVRSLLEQLSNCLDEAGRRLADIAVAVMVDMADCGNTDEQQIDRLGELCALGVDHVIARTRRIDPESDLEQMVGFATSANCVRDKEAQR